ncbi:GDSL esterase/lipase EXL3-like [Prosopis cineraria]|uniref:GDSL esterase/lipase EXL3-like n=1 Tax=Prosopis cineraria TaxID=364024 RepID=UPI00241095DA|nr:GDSL esterase/lipase EXL3-like [Prosopis cineraria]
MVFSQPAGTMAVLMKLGCSFCFAWRPLLHLMLLLVVSRKAKCVVKLPLNISVPAIFAFGDSIMDTGNNNNLKTVVKCNFPPYGQNFEGGKPTGRFCNGKVPSDIIAEELGIKEFLPAYLDPNLKPNDLPTGVCFASGASGYDPLTPKIVSVIPMSAQVEMFKEYIGKLKGIVGEERTNFILANAVALVVSGSDDIANTYFTARVRQLQYDVPAYTDLMANSASDFIKEIHELGLRRIGVFSAPPIGCVPSQRTLAGGEVRECAEKHNEAARLFNSKLSKKLDSLNRDSPNSRIVYIDVYGPLRDIIQNYKRYGFQVVDRGCCGTGEIEVAVLCNPLDATCGDASNYVFWDSYHPSEAAYRKLISPLLQSYVNKFF